MADNADTAAPNATITVALAGRTITFELEGNELSADSNGEFTYLSNASKGFVADEVERAILKLVQHNDGTVEDD